MTEIIIMEVFGSYVDRDRVYRCFFRLADRQVMASFPRSCCGSWSLRSRKSASIRLYWLHLFWTMSWRAYVVDCRSIWADDFFSFVGQHSDHRIVRRE